MPSYRLTLKALERSKRIRETASAYERERVERKETQDDIRLAVHSVSASDFLAEVKC